MLPVHFEQMYIRLYWKDNMEDLKQTDIIEKFSNIDGNYKNLICETFCYQNEICVSFYRHKKAGWS